MTRYIHLWASITVIIAAIAVVVALTPLFAGAGSAAGPTSADIDIVAIDMDPYEPAFEEDSAGPDTCGDSLDNGGDTVADAGDPDCLNDPRLGYDPAFNEDGIAT